jgi:HK97 family phage major capsid protein
MNKYQQAVEELRLKTERAHEIVKSKPDYNWTEEEVNKFQEDQKELKELNEKVMELKAIHDEAERQKGWLADFQRPADNVGFNMGDDARSEGRDERAQKSLGELFVADRAYQEMKGRTNPQFAVDMPEHTMRKEQKATITTAAGFSPYPTRLPRVIESAQRRPMVGDLMPNTNTTQSAIKYMEETTFTNAAAPVAENASKPESALAWTERTAPVEVIATYIPITEQQLEDVDGIQSTVDNRLTLMLMLAEENQLLNGTGTSPQLQGYYSKSGVQTQAKGADPVPDAIYKAMTKVRHTGFAEPDGVVLHPNDWQDVRLLRTADGLYIWGNPSQAGPETIWGKPVVATSAATENTGLVGDFGLFSELFRKRGIRVEVGRINDDFIKNKLTIRAEERVVLAIYRATAYCLVTGI